MLDTERHFFLSDPDPFFRSVTFHSARHQQKLWITNYQDLPLSIFENWIFRYNSPSLSFFQDYSQVVYHHIGMFSQHSQELKSLKAAMIQRLKQVTTHPCSTWQGGWVFCVNQTGRALRWGWSKPQAQKRCRSGWLFSCILTSNRYSQQMDSHRTGWPWWDTVFPNSFFQ